MGGGDAAQWLDLHGLASLLCLIPPRTTYQGTEPPTEGWALVHQLAIKKMPPQTRPQDSLKEAIPQRGSLFPHNSGLYQVDK